MTIKEKIQEYLRGTKFHRRIIFCDKLWWKHEHYRQIYVLCREEKYRIKKNHAKERYNKFKVCFDEAIK